MSQQASLITSLFFIVLFASPEIRADSFGSSSNTFDIEFVTIGTPGNPADTTGNPNPAGSVNYTYRIGKFEISEDMINKANTISQADGNPLGILHANRGTNKPATDIDWFEAAEFVNWLNISTGNSPAYKFDSNNNFQLWASTDVGYNPTNLYRNSLARYVLPNVDEWYKAAYYDPNNGIYYDYPTGSNTAPDGIDFAGDPNFEVVYSTGGSNPLPNDITDVGVLSPFGTAGQGGNALEWEETEFDLINDSASSRRGFRGGTWNVSGELRSTNRFGMPPTNQSTIGFTGFRIASIVIPEPATCGLAIIATLCLAMGRRSSL